MGLETVDEDLTNHADQLLHILIELRQPPCPAVATIGGTTISWSPWPPLVGEGEKKVFWVGVFVLFSFLFWVVFYIPLLTNT